MASGTYAGNLFSAGAYEISKICLLDKGSMKAPGTWAYLLADRKLIFTPELCRVPDPEVREILHGLIQVQASDQLLENLIELAD